MAAATPLVEPSSELRHGYMAQSGLQTPAPQRPAQAPASAMYPARGAPAADLKCVWPSNCAPFLPNTDCSGV